MFSGQYVRGEASEGSDVDILVEFEDGGKTFDNFVGLKDYLEELIGRRVDLVTVEGLKPRLKDYILEEVIYA